MPLFRRRRNSTASSTASSVANSVASNAASSWAPGLRSSVGSLFRSNAIGRPASMSAISRRPASMSAISHRPSTSSIKTVATAPPQSSAPKKRRSFHLKDFRNGKSSILGNTGVFDYSKVDNKEFDGIQSKIERSRLAVMPHFLLNTLNSDKERTVELALRMIEKIKRFNLPDYKLYCDRKKKLPDTLNFVHRNSHYNGTMTVINTTATSISFQVELMFKTREYKAELHYRDEGGRIVKLHDDKDKHEPEWF